MGEERKRGRRGRKEGASVQLFATILYPVDGLTIISSTSLSVKV